MALMAYFDFKMANFAKKRQVSSYVNNTAEYFHCQSLDFNSFTTNFPSYLQLIAQWATSDARTVLVVLETMWMSRLFHQVLKFKTDKKLNYRWASGGGFRDYILFNVHYLFCSIHRCCIYIYQSLLKRDVAMLQSDDGKCFWCLNHLPTNTADERSIPLQRSVKHSHSFNVK